MILPIFDFVFVDLKIGSKLVDHFIELDVTDILERACIEVPKVFQVNVIVLRSEIVHPLEHIEIACFSSAVGCQIGLVACNIFDFGERILDLLCLSLDLISIELARDPTKQVGLRACLFAVFKRVQFRHIFDDKIDKGRIVFLDLRLILCDNTIVNCEEFAPSEVCCLVC